MGVYGVEIRLLARLWLALNPDNGRIHVIHFVEQLLNEKIESRPTDALALNPKNINHSLTHLQLGIKRC